MRKLVLLMLVLGMTSLANAGIVVDTVPDFTYGGDVITLVIGNDTPAAGGTIDLTLNVSCACDGRASVLGEWMLPPATAATITEDYHGVDFDFTNGTIGLNVMGDWLEVSFTVSRWVKSGMTVDLTWGGTILGMTPDDVSILVLIPEPTTITLLGLGGLVLLRRRKK